MTAVSGTTVTVARAAKGSTATAHAAGKAFYKLSTEMNLASPMSGQYQTGYFNSLRTDTPAMLLPAKGNPSAKPWYDYFLVQYTGTRGAFRGGYWSNTSIARSGALLGLNNPPSSRYSNLGFRSALSL